MEIFLTLTSLKYLVKKAKSQSTEENTERESTEKKN